MDSADCSATFRARHTSGAFWHIGASAATLTVVGAYGLSRRVHDAIRYLSPPNHGAGDRGTGTPRALITVRVRKPLAF